MEKIQNLTNAKSDIVIFPRLTTVFSPAVCVAIFFNVVATLKKICMANALGSF